MKLPVESGSDALKAFGKRDTKLQRGSHIIRQFAHRYRER